MLTFYISRIKTTDGSEKFTLLYQKHRDKMMGAAFAILKNHHDAEEAVQNALFAISRNIDTIPDPDTKLGESYAVKAAKNHALNIAKKQAKAFPLFEDIAADSISVQNEYFSREQIQNITEMICSMKPIYRDVLIARYLYEMSPKEISSVYGIPFQTVKTRLKRGAKILKEAFKRGERNV